MRFKGVALMIVALLILPSIVNAQTAISSADAQKTQQMKSIEGNIGYLDLLNPNERYSFNVNFLPPDGISKVEGMDITFMGDFASETIFSVNFNGVACSPDRWPTPKAGSSNYKMTFSCMAAIREAKDVNSFRIEATSNKEALNVIGSYKINYQSDWNLPSTISEGILKPSMTMHGTEYIIGEKAKVWLQAIDALGTYVDTASCYLNIYYPYGMHFISDAPMSFLEKGIYYYDVIAPNVIGVYPAVGLCYYSIAAQEETADAGYILNGTQGSGSYSSTATKNNIYWNVDEALVNGVQRIAVGLNYTSVPSLTGLTEVDFNFQGRWEDSVDVITIYFYNWTTSSWQALPNTIPDTGSADLDVSNSIQTSNATISGIRFNGNIYLQFRDTNGADVTSSRLRIDYMAVSLLNLSGEKATEIKGSSEMHISSPSDISKFVVLSDECGNTITSTEAAICGRVVNYTNGGLNYAEGEMEVNLTVTSLASDDNTMTEWVYFSPISFDCTSLMWITFWNGTSYVDVTDDAEVESRFIDENCKITMPINANISGVYYYTVVMDNYIRWEINWIEQQRQIIHNLIYPRCSAYASTIGYNYTVPILEDTYVSLDDYLAGCHRFLDDNYYMSKDYNDSIAMTTINELTVPFVELRWYESSMCHQLGLASAEIGFTIYDLETAINASVLGNAPANMWSYPNRTLTDYNQTLTHYLLNQIVSNTVEINATLMNMNQSIDGKLVLIRGDIENLLNNLSISLANVSNMTMVFNISGDLSLIANDVWELFFQRGTPPLAPSTDYYCSPTDNNVLIKNITYDYKGSAPIAGYFSKEEAVLCSYGCVNRTLFIGHAECDLDPTTKYGFAIGVAIIVIVAIALIWKFVIAED